MIQIRPEDLRFAAALATVRRRPSRSTGHANAVRFHQLSYDGGGHWMFTTTDFRVSMVSQFPVEGRDEPWECRVPCANFEAFAAVAAGGRLALNPSSSRCVRAEKWSPPEIDPYRRQFLFTYPLYRHPDPTPYPCHGIVGETQPVVIRRALLRDALGFAAPSRGEKDGATRLDTCTITADGTVVAHSEKVFFRAAADPTGFDVNIPGPDAGRLGGWLGLLDGLPTAEVELASGTDPQGRPCYQFRTPDRAHTFRVTAAPRPAPTEFVRQVGEEPAAISGTVEVQPLREIAGCFRAFRDALQCRFARDDGQWRLHVTTTGDNPEGGGALSLGDCQVADEAVARTRLLVSAAHLRTAVSRHRPGRLHLSYHSRARTLSLTDSRPTQERPGPAGCQSIVRVAGARSAAEGA